MMMMMMRRRRRRIKQKNRRTRSCLKLVGNLVSNEQKKITFLSFLPIGTVLFSSKTGSGGGAIELIAENGTLTVGN